MKRRTGIFTARSDDGREYRLYIYTDYVRASSFQHPSAVVEGLREIRTADGRHVNRLEKGHRYLRSCSNLQRTCFSLSSSRH